MVNLQGDARGERKENLMNSTSSLINSRRKNYSGSPSLQWCHNLIIPQLPTFSNTEVGELLATDEKPQMVQPFG